MKPNGLIPALKWVIPVLVLLVLVAFTVDWWADTARGELPVLGEVPDFIMTERSGHPYGRDDMDGRIHIVNFIFTSCPGVCPVMNGNLADLYRRLAGSDQVRFVSISVDPDRDSLPTLRAYADSIGVTDDRWVFLRAPIEDVVQLCEKGFMLPADNLPMGHTFRVTLVDRRGRIRGYYDGTDTGSMKILVRHLRLLAGERP